MAEATNTPMEGKLVHNPSTGEVGMWDGQTVTPLPGKLVTNEKTGKQALWDGKVLTPININIDPNQPTAKEDQALIGKIPQGTPTPAAKPESLMEQMLRLGRMGAGIALPVAGGIGGAALGAASPIPGGALMGEMAGSAGGEYLAQKLGVAEPSNAQIGLAAASPIGGRALGALGRALPISRAGAVKQLTKLLPSETSAALFKKAGANELDQQALVGPIQAVINMSQKLGKESPATSVIDDVFDQLTTTPNMSLKGAESLKDTLQGYINHYSHLGGQNYNPTVAGQLKGVRAALMESIEAANPGYKAAIESYGREQNVKRLGALISKSADPEKVIKELRSTPISDLSAKNKLMMNSFDDVELDQIQDTLGRLAKKVSLQQWVSSRLAGAAMGGMLGYQGGGSREAIGAGVLAGMLGYPIGRRMINEMVKSGTINNPSAVSTAVQLFRASVSRLPKSAQSQQEPQSEGMQQR